MTSSAMYRLDEFFHFVERAPRRDLDHYAVIAAIPPEELLIVHGLAYRVVDLTEEDRRYLRCRAPDRLRLGLPMSAIEFGHEEARGYRVALATSGQPPLPPLALLGLKFLGRPVHLRDGRRVEIVIPCEDGEQVMLKLRYG